MTNAEIKRLSKGELITRLTAMTEKCDGLEKELETARGELANREIHLSEAGTLAEAALKVNGVLEAADKAGAQYVENLHRMHKDQEETARRLLSTTQEQCAIIENETRARCDDMIDRAKAESQAYWDEVYERIKQYSEAMESLKVLLQKMPEGE